MTAHNLPINVGTGTTTGHYAHTNAIHAIINRFQVENGSVGTNGLWTLGGLDVAGILLTLVHTTTLTGTTYTIGWADWCKVVYLGNASPVTVTVPTNAADALPIGYSTTLVQDGAGQVTVAPASGVTIDATPGLKLVDQNSSAQLIKRATNRWTLIGRLTS